MYVYNISHTYVVFLQQTVRKTWEFGHFPLYTQAITARNPMLKRRRVLLLSDEHLIMYLIISFNLNMARTAIWWFGLITNRGNNLSII